MLLRCLDGEEEGLISVEVVVMDVVEVPRPGVVRVSKLMGSDGCGGPGGVTVESSVVGHSSEAARSSFFSQKDAICDVNTPKPAFWNKMPEKLSTHASQVPSFHSEGASVHNIGSTRSSPLVAARSEAKQSPRKSGKVAKTNTSCSKRSWIAQMEVSLNVTGLVDKSGLPKELGSYPQKCNNIADKTQTAKQKLIATGRRGDKRNGKISKNKCDSFSVKAGLLSFSSAAGGNNILGVYGSKPEICDFTKHLDELSLNELLDGSYKCPSFDKDKGKKTANVKESILLSFREACSLLRPPKPTRPQNMADVDSNHQPKVSPCPAASVTSLASRSDDDKSDTANPYSSNKVQDSCSPFTIPANKPDSLLYIPKDILDRIALPPAKDLDLLLLDAAKHTVASRNNSDLRLGKPVHLRGGLPTFPWSHISGGHSKSNPDAVKLTTSRSTCQGRWVKIGNSTTSLGETVGFLVDLDSLTYDQNLVPPGDQGSGSTENKNSSTTSDILTPREQGFSSSATCSMASEHQAELSPRVLAAAQTLCDIAAHSLKQDPQGINRWPKKPSQKAMKAIKLKSDAKSEKVFATPTSRVSPDSLVNCANEMIPSKKLRLSMSEKSDDISCSSLTQGPLNWSTPRSSRSTPCKPFREPVSESRHYDANIVKKPYMTPPPTRVSDKATKLRKLMPLEWCRPD